MSTLQPYMTLIYAGLGLLALLIMGFILLRIFGSSVKGRKGSRLGISEYYEIDKSRRLVLVRRDDMEHLLLIGGNQDVVIESSVSSPLMSGAPVVRQAPRPAVFGGRRPMLRPVEGGQHRDDPEL